MKPLISPSILSANFAALEDDILMLNKSEADLIHVDVMDGVFVPNISFGFPVIAAVKNFAKKPLDVHLMIVEPDKYLKQFYNDELAKVKAPESNKKAFEALKNWLKVEVFEKKNLLKLYPTAYSNINSKFITFKTKQLRV